MGNFSSTTARRLITVQIINNRPDTHPMDGFLPKNNYTLEYTILSNASIQDLLDVVNKYRQVPLLDLYQNDGRVAHHTKLHSMKSPYIFYSTSK